MLMQHDHYSEEFSMEALGEVCRSERVFSYYVIHAVSCLASVHPEDVLLGCLHPVPCVRSDDGSLLYPSTQRHYRRLILLLNTTYTATCFDRTTIFMQKIYY
jgi:hypothetical protein